MAPAVGSDEKAPEAYDPGRRRAKNTCGVEPGGVRNTGPVPSNEDVVRSLSEQFPEDPLAMTREERRQALERALGEATWPDVQIAMVAPGGWGAERQGLDGYMEGWDDWLAPFDSFRLEFEDFLDAGDQVVVLVRQFARPKGAGAHLENAGAAVFTFREDRIERIEFHLSRDDALRSAGLEPERA
jgi:SnoaL-like domain